VTSGGQPVQLHGVNRSGTEFVCSQGFGIFNGPHDAASLEAIRSWRVNAVRVPLNEDCWLAINGVSPNFSGVQYQQAIKEYVDLLNQNGLYAILDLHWSAPGTDLAQGQEAMPDLDHAPAFWSSVASVFGTNNAVILELFNEPWPDSNLDTDAAWTCWRDGGTCPGVGFEAAGMQTLVDAVRATGATNVIALTGVQWGNSVSHWLAYKPNDPLNQLVASWHVYDNSWCVTVACYDSNAGPTAAQVPLLATEFGAMDCNTAFLTALMNWLDNHGASYVAWVWNAWGVECNHKALVADYAGGPTSYGEIYRSHLAGLP
jgi:endoglucanase